MYFYQSFVKGQVKSEALDLAQMVEKVIFVKLILLVLKVVISLKKKKKKSYRFQTFEL